MRLLLVLALIAVGLALTNPDRDAFVEFVEDKVADQVTAEASDVPGGGLIGEIGGFAAGRLVQQFAQRDNYVVASVYTLDLDGPNREADDWRFLGIGTFFVELQRPERVD